MDDAALAVATELGRGSDLSAAVRRISGAFLERNRVTRSEVGRAIADLVGDEAISPVSGSCGLALVLTAIPSEYTAVTELLCNRRPVETRSGTRYEVGTTNGAGCTWEVAVAEVGPGNVGTAAEVSAAVAEFDPDLFLFVGVAGGVDNDLACGSVVVADRVYYYERGRAEAEEWLARPLVIPTSHRLVQLAKAVARDWHDATVVVKPIAAGEALVGAATSEVARIIRSHYNDSAAVDMESAGLYESAHRSERPALAIRGVSDHLDDKSSAADDDRQSRAARNAAKFMIALLRAADRGVVKRRAAHGVA